jgi:DNA-binding NtrC family response regulator
MRVLLLTGNAASAAFQKGLIMPASVVVVHDDPDYVGQLTVALSLAGYDALSFVDPIHALNALDASQWLEVLVTRVHFGPGKINGVALARMARSKRPGIRVLFTALPEYAEYANGLGKFLPMPVSVPDVVDTVVSMLQSDRHDPPDASECHFGGRRGGCAQPGAETRAERTS